ncbi:MAG: T9SS type A sorting domain-containing protein [Chitinophagales bacterium]|nr:T9SS type A sorting domain-containing protein [Chitinophagales bacterium]
MAIKFFSLCCFCLTVTVNAFCQPFVNLVPNPSFEEFQNGCPANFHEMPLHWTWWRESPNSFSTCVQPQNLNDSLGWAPWNGFGTQEPANGESYVGLCAFGQTPSGGFREYLGCELLAPMDVGETYYVSFKTSPGFGNYYGMYWSCSHIGAIFTTQGYLHPNNAMPIPNFAHVYANEVIADTAIWTVVFGTIVADKPYTHLGLGLFFEPGLFDTFRLAGGPTLGSYYFFDDVCVSRSPDCLTVGINHLAEPAISLFPNPASDWLQITGIELQACVRLFTATGQLVLTHQWAANGQHIDVSSLPAGIYYAEIETKTKHRRKKLSIAR